MKKKLQNINVLSKNIQRIPQENELTDFKKTKDLIHT